jgi:hypothetical protein
MANIYVTPDFSDVTQAMIDDCHESSFESLRHTTQGTDKVLLKYSGDDPAWIVTLGLIKYSYSEILSILSETDWTWNPE